MITADYVFYEMVYRGEVPSSIGDDFYRLAPQAAAYLEQITQGRVLEELSDNMTRKVNLAYCGVIDALLLNEQGGGVVAESNDGVSVTYASAKTAKTDGQRLYEAAALFLGGTGLLYRGVGR